MTAAPGPGHNAPTLPDLLADCAEEGRRIPDALRPEHLPRVVDWLRKAALLLSDAEAERKAQKAGPLAAGREIDRTWNAATDPLDGTVAVIRHRLASLPALPQQIRGDSGVTVATITPTLAHEVTDIAAVPIDALRPYLEIAAVEKAIAKAVAAGVALPGVRTFTRNSLTVR